MEAVEGLIGAMVGRIYMDDKHLTFVTDKGTFTLAVSKQQCPQTFFCDFYGANNLFGNKIKKIIPIPVSAHNRNYRHTLPKHRSLQKKIGYKVFHEFNEKTPNLLGYEIIIDGFGGSTPHSIFSVQCSPDTPVPVTLVSSRDHVFDEENRILKPVFRMTPRTDIRV